ncbi:MAG: acyltransferase [Bdellovibrionaceae bacterium]|nr:acyltransferase [Bdellovibrionales bacterium]MCB9254079.1 acyltransferase [Pseudobdellovibrionaceae bacterium]
MLRSIAEKRYHHAYIDGLRGVAILLVLVQHTYRALLQLPKPMSFPFLGGFLTTGGLGVPLFFIVSAFTLFGSSQKRWENEKSPIRNFYIRRLFRIFPLWGFAVLVYGALQHSDLETLWINFSMWFGFLRFHNGLEVVHVQWSLFVEEAFYLFLPLVFTFIRTGRNAFYFFLLTFFTGMIWLQYAALWGIPTSNHFIEMFPLNHWYCFAIGIMLHFWKNDSVFNSPEWGKALGVGALVLFITLCRQPFPYNTGAVLVVFVAAMHPGSWVGWLCRTRLFRSLGIACYSIYLTHPLLIKTLTPTLLSWVAQSPLKSLPFEIIFVAWLVVIVTVSLGVAVLSFNLIEKPSVRLGKKCIQWLEQRKSLRVAKAGA